MTIACPAPDASLGVALRLSTYVDCQARALGENGFQALVGGPVVAGLLSGLVTIFVALIGFRLILGTTPSLRDGIGWTARLGIVLALTTGWPAFETLVYDVATDGPGELAGVVLPASGLSAIDLDTRVQEAYDTIRLGVEPAATQASPPPAPTSSAPGQTAPTGPITAAPSPDGRLPQTASALVICTSGVIAALRIATGFLLAVGPLALLALLFDATLGLFSGWVRALSGAGLALVAASIVTALELAMVEGELATLQGYGRGLVSEAVDPQAIITLVLLFAVAMLVAVLLAMRMAGTFTLPLSRAIAFAPAAASQSSLVERTVAPATVRVEGIAAAGAALGRPRAASVAEALSLSVLRERQSAVALASAAGGDGRSRALPVAQSMADPSGMLPSGAGAYRRRALARRTRTAKARDGSA